jgi:hypothetical protein
MGASGPDPGGFLDTWAGESRHFAAVQGKEEGAAEPLASPRRPRGVASDPPAARTRGRAQHTASGYTPDPLAARLRLLPLPLSLHLPLSLPLPLPLPLPAALAARPPRCAPLCAPVASPSRRRSATRSAGDLICSGSANPTVRAVFDADRDGLISFREFAAVERCAILANENGADSLRKVLGAGSMARLRRAWNRIAGGSESIPAATALLRSVELAHQSIGIDADDTAPGNVERVQAVRASVLAQLNEIDCNHDGTITFAEFESANARWALTSAQVE